MEGQDGKDELLDGLNPAQRAAVTSQANILQVLAPPGSGKTKTLTARVSYLISRCGYKPWNILVCTFTVKAAREMKARIKGLVGDGLEKKLILGTFHSVARRFLASYGHYIGFDKGFGIADTSDTKAIIKRIIKDHDLTIEPGKAQARISSNKAKSITADQFAATAKKNRADEQEFMIVYSGYQAALEMSNLLDYDDLLLKCAFLLRSHPQCVSNIQAVLIDEFQDTNEVQFELMNLFAQARRTITIVGDPDQSIYGWRNAEIENLNKMKRQHTDTVVIFLEENYRSTGAILASAQIVIEQDQSRPDKRLQATHARGELPVLRRLPTADAEARWLVAEIQRVQAMSGGLLQHNDFAILLRSAQLSRHIETALGKAGVPYRMVGGTKFYDRAEIKILLDYLRVINQPEHNDALLRIINVPARNVGEVTVKKLLDEAAEKRLPLWKLLVGSVQGRSKTKTRLTAQAEKGLMDFANVILSGQRKCSVANDKISSPAELLDFLLKRLDYEKFLKKKYTEDQESRWANVEELKAQTSDLSAAIESGDPDVEEERLPDVEGTEQQISENGADALSIFLANIALSGATEQKDAQGTAQQQCITISTIHAAKGLEWPVVFIPACYEGSIPHSRAEDNDEERRLLYVGMTRAQAMLYLSCPVKNSQSQETTLSSFLTHTGVEASFDVRGPELEYHRINQLALTLGRPCPGYEAVEESRTQVVLWDDNYWPEDGSFPLEESSRWDHGFSVSATTLMHSTFASASSRMQELEKMHEDSTLCKVDRRGRTAPATEEKTSKGTKTAVPSKHGGNIASFFGGRPTAPEAVKRPPSRESRPPPLPISFDKVNPVVERSERKPPSHRPRTTPLTRPVVKPAEMQDKYVFMSSSPPRELNSEDEERENKRPKVIETPGFGVKPAATMHTTSVANVAGRKPAGIRVHTGPVKKTLGLGRGFKPWSARGR
ncbi:UvrD-helicase-domain-containing protein [Myriangium duriaei CBS 260.36]|uniref:DNA 3'-5' helicase n=1 Tax=Myriangium duriaei CBS 260.36 TaxID=1168546 RepID=A0A9P4IXP3_9PEZI|nr:UvrD-helicase-domain-containing protein [Myriangium duriaei CBS 260.36]